MSDKQKEADKLWKQASKYMLPSVLEFRLKPDWDQASPILEKCGLLYKQAGALDKAKVAYEKAAQAQEKLGSPWHGAKHLETCGDLAKQQSQWEEVAVYYKRASQLYQEAGKGSTGADALVRGAKSLEESNLPTAMKMYYDALQLLEDEGKQSQAGDVFRSTVGLLIKQQSWSEAVALLVKFGSSCENCGAVSSQCKAYLGAVVVGLYAQDAKSAWTTYQDVLAVDSFASSSEAFCAQSLMEAYQSGSVDNVKKVVANKSELKYLDYPVARLATKLPVGDVAAMGQVLTPLMSGGALGGGAGGSEDDDDEVL